MSDADCTPGREPRSVAASFIIMVALWNRADHYIFILSFVVLLFFPRVISAVAEWMSAILAHQKSPSVHHRTTLSGYIFATEVRIDSRKKTCKQQYVLHMSS